MNFFKTKSVLVLVVTSVAFLTPGASFAAVYIGALGGGAFLKPEQDPKEVIAGTEGVLTVQTTLTNVVAKKRNAYGLSLEWVAVPSILAFEVDALYTEMAFNNTYYTRVDVRRSLFSEGSSDVLTEVKGYQFPLLIRTFFLGEWISLGAGAYYYTATGNVKTTTTASGTGYHSAKERSYAEAKYKETDWGLTGSLRLRVPLWVMDLVVDGRYFYGFEDQNLSENETYITKFRGYLLLGGLRFAF